MKYSLPDPSNDLLIKDGKLLMKTVSVYELLRRFSHILKLTPFRFEDFTAALLAEDQSALLSEVHIQLLRTLIREDKQQQTWLGPPDIRDSVNLYLYLADHSSWPAALKIYLSADPYSNADLLDLLHCHEDKCYPFKVGIKVRLEVLEQLCNQFLMSVMAREDIVNGTSLIGKHEASCRLCSKPNGDLIACGNCPAVYHLKCSDPPLENFPNPDDGDEMYRCAICRSNHVEGVSDCVSQEERAGSLKRHEALGLDKMGRRYWFIVRRLFVVDETEDDVRYFTTAKQFEEITDNLNENRYEKSLIDNLQKLSDEILRQMKITEDLYSTLMKEHKNEDGTYSALLGQDGSHRDYTNNYSSNNLAIGKNQTFDRDTSRALSNKFCMTIVNSFKWFGAIDGHLNTIAQTIRTSILKFEASLPSTFVHPCWRSQRSQWIKTINYAQKPQDFATALSRIESCIKPVLFKAAYYDTCGFVHLFRSTFSEREEMKKTDRQPRGFERRECVTADFELSSRLGTMVKFSARLKPVKHQVWKQKGEEYRLTGLNGWYWQSSTRRKASKSQRKQPWDWSNCKANQVEEGQQTNQNTPNKCAVAKPKLPPLHNFRTRHGQVRSLLVLPELELRKVARSGGQREARSFSYTAKQNIYIWPYGMTPRPNFRTCWLYRNQLIDTMQDVSLQLKVLNACMRWDDLTARPPVSGHNTIVTDDVTITIELLKRRDKLPYLTHSEYLIRRTTTSNEQPTKYRKISSRKSTPSARTGLRARRLVEEEEEKGPTTEEIWVSEEELALWELKQFDEKIERQNAMLRERALREEAERRRKLEEEKRRAAEQERRRIRAEEEAVRRARLAQTGVNSMNSSSPRPNSINIPPPQQRSQPATTPVLRYFRTEQGQIIRLPASYLQRGTPLILRHVSPGTKQTNTYIIRPQATPSPIVPVATAAAPAAPTTAAAAATATTPATTTTATTAAATTTAATTTTTATTTNACTNIAEEEPKASVGTVANEMAHDQHAPVGAGPELAQADPAPSAAPAQPAPSTTPSPTVGAPTPQAPAGPIESQSGPEAEPAPAAAAETQEVGKVAGESEPEAAEQREQQQ